MPQMNLSKTRKPTYRNQLTDVENRFVATKGSEWVGGRKGWESAVSRSKLLYT